MEEQVQNTEVSSEISNEAPAATEVTETAQNERPEGYDLVDPYKDDPAKIEKRINYLYKQFRTTNETANQYKDIAEQQSRVIAALQADTGAIVNHLQERTFNDTEAQVRAQMQSALDIGDMSAFNIANEKLIDIKLQKAQIKKPAAAPRQPTQQQQPQYQPSNPVQTEELRIVEAWQDETDEAGNPIRPWANNNGNNAAEYAEAEAQMAIILTNPKYKSLSIDKKLEILDQRMGLSKKSNNGQTVMGANLTQQKKSGRVTLSPKMQEIAIRTKFGGSKAKSDSDHIEAYRKQLETVQSKKRSQ